MRAVRPPRRLRRHPSSSEEGKFDPSSSEEGKPPRRFAPPLLKRGGEVPTKLRLVLDTNIWLDWLVFDDPSIAPIKAAVAAGRAEVFMAGACEAELERALGYDLGKRAVDIAACITKCRRVARRIDSVAKEAERARLPACRDPDDQKFLEAALAAGAGFLVTKDRALLELARRAAPFRIVTPEGFEKADPSRRPG